MTDHLDLKTPDGVSQNIERIAALFPHCVTETADGKQIDFDLLRQELSADIVEGPKERYRLEWPGKREAIVNANMPTTNTLRPVREDSVNFDTTENLYIEGDNLEVLKLLQESYLGKVKMIYIDPPYNTGNDFVYKDNFTQDTEEFKADSGMTDELGNRLVANPETAGRYHSDWLTMMYPRLKLARNLLTDDGVIYISIDDNEVHNLRKMCDEVFGEVNFVGNVVWEKMYTTKNDSALMSECHEYILVYTKDINLKPIQLLPRTAEMDARYSNPDNDPRGDWKAIPLYAKGERKNGRYPVVSPTTGKTHFPGPDSHWLYAEADTLRMISENRISFGKDGNSLPNIKRFLTEVQQGAKSKTIWKHNEVGSNDSAKRELKELYDNIPFDFPKPTTLIKRMLQLAAKSDDIILDFFSGSATTAHAVMQLNAEDGGNRKFIMVQLPEKTDEKSEAYKAGYQNICEIGKERIRRAGKKLTTPFGSPEGGEKESAPNLFDNAENAQLLPSGEVGRGLDVGFRVFRLDTNNMQDVYYRPQDYKQEMMTELFANHIKPDRTPDDLVAQVMLDWGLPLSLPIEQTTIAGKTVYKVAGNALYCCFDEHISEDFARAVAPEKPLRIVFHDYAFASDTAKENVRQLLKQLSGETEMRVV
jgi:adenine-specific DNA-methyltransferase